MCIKALSDQIFVCYGRTAIIIVKWPIEQPIAKMKACVPEIIIAFALHELNPFLHTGILLFLNFLITICQVHVPWYNGAHVCPACRSGCVRTKYIWDNKRNASALQLI